VVGQPHLATKRKQFKSKLITSLRVVVYAPSFFDVRSIRWIILAKHFISYIPHRITHRLANHSGLSENHDLEVVHPIVYKNHSYYQTGVSLSKVEMRPVEKRLECHPILLR
jgi:hypothetical protein